MEYIVQLAETDDIEKWMAMIEPLRGNFPGLDTPERLAGYEETVIKNMKRQTAICAKQGSDIVGILLFSYNARCLSCMAVDPAQRRNGIASAMITRMLSLFPADVDITVTTFREDDEKGIAPRRLYSKFGFAAAELLEEFDYPHQRFVLTRSLQTEEETG